MKWPSTTIGQLCLPTEQRDPTASPDKPFRYIDISAIDKDAKRITSAPELQGTEAPSRARKVLRAGDVLVSTVRPNLNAVAIVPEELDGEIASTG
ncbi:MAG: restriction endonuclease subunit S, partial [Verrucomicrobia bacterium]|nr:restriction endonuclease subunit S [Verrucomicrobiota bacterium]